MQLLIRNTLGAGEPVARPGYDTGDWVTASGGKQGVARRSLTVEEGDPLTITLISPRSQSAMYAPWILSFAVLFAALGFFGARVVANIGAEGSNQVVGGILLFAVGIPVLALTALGWQFLSTGIMARHVVRVSPGRIEIDSKLGFRTRHSVRTDLDPSLLRALGKDRPYRIVAVLHPVTSAIAFEVFKGAWLPAEQAESVVASIRESLESC